MTGVYAYVRVSTTKQGERGVSLQEQRSAIEAYCQKHSLQILEWYEEQETAATQGRRVFLAIIKQLRKSSDRGLVVHKIDRSARNLKDWAMIQDLIDAGVPVHFAHESLDLNTRGGRLAADIQAVVAADFIRNLRDEVRKGIYGRLKQGLYPFRAPIGYLDNGGGKVKTIDPSMGPLVKLGFELYDSGRFNVDTLNDELHRRGLRNRVGKKLSRNGICTLLKNSFYTGLIKIEKSGQVFAGIHEPLIKRALFDRVQDRLIGRAKQQGLRHDFIFRKLLRCAGCNYSLIGERQKQFIYYRCHDKNCLHACVREDRIASAFEHESQQLKLGRKSLTRLRLEGEALLAKRFGQKTALLKSADLRLAQISDRLTRLTDAYVDRLVDRDTYMERREQLLTARLSTLEEKAEIETGNAESRRKLEKFLELAKGLCDKAAQLNPGEHREMLESVTSNLSIDRKRLVVAWQKGFRALALDQKKTNGEATGSRTFPSKGGQQRIRTRAFYRSVIEDVLAPEAYNELRLPRPRVKRSILPVYVGVPSPYFGTAYTKSHAIFSILP